MEITFSVYHLNAEGKEFNLINAFVTCSPQSGRRGLLLPYSALFRHVLEPLPLSYGMSKR